MWEFLKSKSRKERERIEKERERIEKEVASGLELERKLEEERIEALFLIENKRLVDKLDLEQSKYTKKELKRVKRLDEICPKCKSKNVVDKISQVKGEINGSSYSGSYGLFGGHSYGSTHGSVDTLEINKCNDCTNEWKKEKYNEYGKPNWENTMRYLRLSVKHIRENPEKKDPYYLKEVNEFWNGTKLDVMELFINRTYFGHWPFSDNYLKEQLLALFQDKDNELILINKIGFVK